MSELVWCVPRKLWDEQIAMEGFSTDKGGDIYRFLLENGVFIERDQAEHDENYKQVVPQGLLRYKNKVYVNQRLPKQSDSRLLYKYSLGVGGHLNPEDNIVPHMDIISMGFHREMAEEVEVVMPFSVKYIGITNDEQAEVSRLHVGVWLEITLIDDAVRVKETEKIRGFWMNIKELYSLSEEFESWAKLIYDQHL